MNARNKLKTSDLMGINTHILYHAHRKNTEWGWGLSKKQTVGGVVTTVFLFYAHGIQYGFRFPLNQLF